MLSPIMRYFIFNYSWLQRGGFGGGSECEWGVPADLLVRFVRGEYKIITKMMKSTICCNWGTR